ncbi:MAG TPA: TerD family protein [Chitinophagales bacterium]|nr:TerD family protein [Chitinophagales bacterium]HQW79576.1 TerD family protein [Chitinophagales bacterium]
MAEVINLRKGDKVAVGFTNITVGLGWEPNEGTGAKFDLDVSAIMIDKNRKTTKDFFIYYGNLCGRRHTNIKDEYGQPKTHSDNDCIKLSCEEGLYGVMHTGDDPDGESSDGGDDESIIIDLTKVPQNIQEILFVVTIAGAIENKQNFGQVRDSYIRLEDNSTGKEVMKYELGEDFSIETGIEFGRLYRRNNEWKFDASGVGYKEDLSFFLNKYFTGTINK